ncbi:ankyrin repeat-containing protein NPR4 isoform X1 [Beta vulgaris subsp. vulgaris]|uniref:ankyrin repeat-containing protein NPR4 isoform X1 n=1 Tax=Beta vulgaris subsp. vulgaris TaxID=3555 RepID=UPI0020374859|nr:ankyrin repeat-containing protein NPR4 isoform X1 [Beta vulgaris subsp. vulgaris]
MNKEETGRRLLEKFWWLINLADDRGKTALNNAKEACVPWLVCLLMNPSLIQKEPFDWITACERSDETWAVYAFIDSCQDLQMMCRDQNDTPLHHIKLRTYRDYFNFLKIPSIAELKNTIDYEGATPLHRALERKDMNLARALLIDNGVERNMEDYHGATSMDLLAKLCKENDHWAKMCKQIKVNPYLKTTYIQPGTNLDQMRNTLSVVAALLATITFAAGFTLPGGLNSVTGDAILGKRASFLVFLLSDAYAMCTSMFVLFCLIWSMVSDRDMSYLLVDRSVLILMQSLYGTMVAFMTGIYTVIGHSSLWAAIIIFAMCSFIGISANRTILHNVLAKLIPAANQDRKDKFRLLEEGKASSSGNKDSQGGEGTYNDAHENHEDHIPLLKEGEASITQNDNSQQATLIPAASQDHEDKLQLLEEGKTSTSGNNNSPRVKGTHNDAHKNHKDQIPLLKEGEASITQNDGSQQAKLIPAANQEQKDKFRLLEEGKAYSSAHKNHKVQIPLLKEGEASITQDDGSQQAKLIPAVNQDQKDKFRLLEEGKAYSSAHKNHKDQIPLLKEGEASITQNDDTLNKPS